MIDEVLNNLPQDSRYIFDWTLGHGWHTKAILKHLEENDKLEDVNLIGVDRDPNILTKAKKRLNKYKNKIHYFQNSYGSIESILSEVWVDKLDAILLDLWVNMEHLKDPDRGFSVQKKGPLDMRFDTTQDFTAYDYLSKTSKDEMIKDMSKYGDFREWKSMKIVRNIKKAINSSSINDTLELVEVLKDANVYYKKIPVVFQVIRIKVNKELEQLEKFLEVFSKFMAKGGVCLIMTYHSIEARIVKYAFQDIHDKDDDFKEIEVIKPHYKEVQNNKAARSAQLRVFRRD